MPTRCRCGWMTTDSTRLLRSAVDSLGGEYSFIMPFIPRLERYCSELFMWRMKVNLVSKTASFAEVIDKHFIDSLLLLPLLKAGDHLLDVGTGAGFPGLVCRSVMPTLGLSMVEPRRKRVNFLRHVCRCLALGDDGAPLTVHEMRLQPDSDSGAFVTGGRVTHLTCRAVTDIASFLEMAAPFADTTLLLMKGPRWEKELAEAREIMTREQFYLEDVRESVLPLTGGERCILTIKKENLE